jgi:protein-disulfide isomerase
MIALALIFTGYTITSGNGNAQHNEHKHEQMHDESDTAAQSESHDHHYESEQSEDIASHSEPSTDSHEFNVEAALKPRTLGEESAPVTIEEFASLSCSHCAAFHQGTFKKLKEKYIDTGKVKFIFNDFPLNAPALDGTITSRCLPESSYFKFIGFLFETQEEWAYESDYKQKLLQNSKLLGLSEERFNTCLNNTDLKTGLIRNMEQAKQEHNISSTPSFVIDGTIKLSGNLDISKFDKIIEDRLAAKESLAE